MTKKFNVYRVGGSLRNEALGKPVADEDFAVEATEAEYEAAFPTHKKVLVNGKFPVYLNEIGREHALTREDDFSEGGGDKNVQVKSVGTAIKNDLARRDFTINSIAEHVETGEVIDPFDGHEDIRRGVLRTINDSFVKDDANRVYRLARFAAELDFTVDHKTAAIVRRDRQYLAAVDPHRILGELKKAYERSSQPSIFFRTLLHLDVLKVHFPYFHVAATIPAGPNIYHHGKSVLEHSLDAFDAAKEKGHGFDVALASLHHDLGKVLTPKDILPHHYKHEDRAEPLIAFIKKTHRFTRRQLELIEISTKHHMRFHLLKEIEQYSKLIRFYAAIKKYATEIIQISDNDRELDAERIAILRRLERVFKETKVVLPEGIAKEHIAEYVLSKRVEKYKELVNKGE
jgi:tRNA nucleotidyltransferase (CCA-adding enzyme)